MTGHLVEQSETSCEVTLRCRDCDWYAKIGRQSHIDHDTRIQIQPMVTLLKWGHQDPSLLKDDAAGESVERSMWRRIRDYALRGVAP